MMFIFLKLVFAILPPNTILTVDVMQEIIVESDWLYNELLTSEDYLSTRTSSLESGSDFWYAVANQLAEQLDTIVQQQTLTELRIHLAQSQIQSRLVSLCSETNLRAMLQLIEKETQIITPYVVAEAFELCAMSVISAEDLLRHAANLLPEGTDLIEELGFLSPEQLLSRTTSGEQGFYNKLLSLPETNINDND